MANHETTHEPLPETREGLMALHRATRSRRNKAAHGSEEHTAANDQTELHYGIEKW